MPIPEIDTTSRVKLNGDVLFQELQGEAVLLDLRSGVYFGLDRVGTRMWELLGEKRVLSSVVETIAEEYDVDAERCGEDLRALVSKLHEQGLLEIELNPSADPPVS